MTPLKNVWNHIHAHQTYVWEVKTSWFSCWCCENPPECMVFTLFTANIQLALPCFTHKNHYLHLHIGNSTINIYVVSPKWQKITIFSVKLGNSPKNAFFSPKIMVWAKTRQKPAKMVNFPNIGQYGKSTYFSTHFYGFIRPKYGLCTGPFVGTYFVHTLSVLSTYSTQKSNPIYNRMKSFKINHNFLYAMYVSWNSGNFVWYQSCITKNPLWWPPITNLRW